MSSLNTIKTSLKLIKIWIFIFKCWSVAYRIRNSPLTDLASRPISTPISGWLIDQSDAASITISSILLHKMTHKSTSDINGEPIRTPYCSAICDQERAIVTRAVWHKSNILKALVGPNGPYCSQKQSDSGNKSHLSKQSSYDTVPGRENWNPKYGKTLIKYL